jgi:hypothetical protein
MILQSITRDCIEGKRRDYHQFDGEYQVWYYMTIKFKEERMDINTEEVNEERYKHSNLTW